MQHGKWGEYGSSGLTYPTPVHLIMPDSAASLCQHIWYIHAGQISKAASLLFLKAKWEHSVFYW